ncbi:hypothetical protein CC1G_08955 [Coprinopsis cinerea okayama7|uniref:Uncharacterized protein n=1 Tax=Coprinopsis cinerea (strain Okayama-7 / 130 / ATCC MYA-4618 / FGSC 9003) TaxID=240176 RepID=A8P4R0_COPC7|nr:hypothetical protein CC1G_08955 [Coprinopsis cinerea okayama7\|eukprot:XP_001838791.2 hypothetical protein CC1G_08955 [Coprinopsis cinerea okayama7\
MSDSVSVVQVGLDGRPAGIRRGELSANSLDEILGPPGDDPAKYYSLRIVALHYEDPQAQNRNRSSKDELSTARKTREADEVGAIIWLAENLGVSPCFFDGALSYSNSTVLELPPPPPPIEAPRSMPMLESEPADPEKEMQPVEFPSRHWTEALRPEDNSLNGVYITQVTGTWSVVWFSHRLDTDLSTYVIHNSGPEATGNLLRYLFSRDRMPKIPLLAIDSLICNEEKLYREYTTRLEKTWVSLQRLEALRSGSLNQTGEEGVEDLEKAYISVYEMDSAFGNKARVLSLLRQVTNTRVKLAISRAETQWMSVPDATQTLLDNMERTVQARQAVIRDSLTTLSTLMNLKLATTSSQLAADARKDSSSMTTIALLTMFFLPGSFVASLFSTQFARDYQPGDSTSKPNLFHPTAWIYGTIVGVVTLAVFAVWASFHITGLSCWRRMKRKLGGGSSGSKKGEKQSQLPIQYRGMNSV